jgi:hypothetical protein
MKKLLIVAFSLLAVLCGIAVYNRPSPAAQGAAKTEENPLPVSKADGITPAKTTTVIAKTAAEAKSVSPSGIPSPQPSSKPEQNANDVEMMQKNMALIQQVSLAVTELPEIKAGIQRVFALKSEYGTATTERKEEINKELKEIQDRHTEAYRNAFRDLGMAESIVQGIQITLPSQPGAAGAAQPVPPKSAEPSFQ